MRYLPGLAWRGLAAVALAACAATAAAADITLEKIKHTGVITIGYRASAAPFSFDAFFPRGTAYYEAYLYIGRYT